MHLKSMYLVMVQLHQALEHLQINWWKKLDSVEYTALVLEGFPNNKIYGANVGPTWGRQDPGGTNVGHTNLVI